MRKKLTVTAIEAPEQVTFKDNTQRLKYGFTAADEGGIEAFYITWSEWVAKKIRVGETVDAEYDETDYQGNVTLKVTKLHGEDKPKSSGFRKSPEELAQEKELKHLERESIESQTAIKFIGQIASGTIQVPDNVMAAAWRWVSKRIGEPIEATPASSQGKEQPPEGINRKSLEERVKGLLRTKGIKGVNQLADYLKANHFAETSIENLNDDGLEGLVELLGKVGE